jgi:hypothetical protein
MPGRAGRCLAEVLQYDGAVRYLAILVGIAAAALLWALLHRQDGVQHALAAEDAARVKAWAYVAREKALSPSEDLRLVVVPSELGRHFDVRCLIYRNRETGATAFTCPDARQDQLDEASGP